MSAGVSPTPRSQAVVDALIAQGRDYSVAEDKAFLAHDLVAEARAREGHAATVKALALVLGVEPAVAAARILTD